MIENNSALRDGPWKLVRPKYLANDVAPEDGKWDRRLKDDPECLTDILHTPEPERDTSNPPPPELYNIDEDPCEQNNLADVHPKRLSRMLCDLENMFDEVEAERLEFADN